MYPPVLSICFRSLRLFAVMVLLLGVVNEGRGQDKVRRYATRQHDFSIALLGLGGSIDNASNAVNGNPRDASTLRFLLGAAGLTYAEQVVDFNPNPAATNASGSPTFPAGTPVFIKLSLPANLLGVLTGIVIQPITNLRNAGGLTGWTYTNVGSQVTGGGLLALLNGAGESEIIITPNTSFQGVRIRLTSALGVSATSQFFHAYVMEDASATWNCEERNAPIDVLSGVRAGSVEGGIVNATGTVTNPWNARDDNTASYALISTGVQLLSEVFHTTIFASPSIPNQAVRVLLQDPGANLLDLNLLSTFQIQPYLRNTVAGSPISGNASTVSLRLLPGSSNKYELTIPVTSSFDRIEIKMGGVAEALTQLRIYEVSRLPRVLVIDDPTELATALTRCGSVDLIGAIANYQPDYYDYQYYTVSTGGSPLPSSAVTASGNYYIEAIDKITGCVSPRVVVTATVLPTPTITIPQLTTACQEDSQIHIVYSATTAAPITYSIDWNTEAESTGFMDIENSSHNFSPTGGTILINKPSAAIPGDYQGILIVKNASGCASENLNLTIKIQPKPPPPLLNINPHSQY